ncbi:MAG: DNA-binding protein [Verrucomicrobiales bacterium]|nr:DNA-binding protein [Verrucomicrobiales bacterium]
METHPFRLKPGQDLKAEIDALTLREKWSAACILSAVGSLTQAAIRFADQEEVSILNGHFEILSLSGTLSPGGSHLHISIADGKGKVTGGHLKEGSEIYTTAEVVIGILHDWEFSRQLCEQSNYLELVAEKRRSLSTPPSKQD